MSQLNKVTDGSLAYCALHKKRFDGGDPCPYCELDRLRVEPLAVSQQSNPATLREALAEIIVDLRRREKRNLNSAHASLRGFAEAAGYAADQLDKVAALAASGTEAAPSDEHPFYSRGTMQALNKLMAAASPEREGREAAEWWHEATLDVCRHARAHDPIDWQSAIKGGLLRAYNRGLDARQSAAPSGGVALTVERIAKVVSAHLSIGTNSDDEPCVSVDCQKIAEELNALLAQESKTGAVTRREADL